MAIGLDPGRHTIVYVAGNVSDPDGTFQPRRWELSAKAYSMKRYHVRAAEKRRTLDEHLVGAWTVSI